ncbi:MAG: CRISPR-associated protein Cas4 [Thermoplasmata archaeon]|jgi:CRISPR/Cas system-associated exonuclease Cas4 (RecB family)|nr:CRISPR-associated protein Cas4 [Thermoplasmata archaeon]
MTSGGAPYVSASDLADYAYCPRSYWYRHHPPPGGPSRDAVRSSTAGTRSHERQLGGERRRAEFGGWYWLLVAVGLLAMVGGILWFR